VLEHALTLWPDGRIGNNKNWSYEEGTVLDGVLAVWRASGDGRLFRYAQAAVDRAVDEKGVIHITEQKTYPAGEETLDDIEMGRSVLTMYRVLQQPRYATAAQFLRDQLRNQPRNAAGGYWHKKIYPNQMWADGAYMAGPFMAGYAVTFQDPEAMDSEATQLLLLDTKLRDRSSGLLHHGWDASLQMAWANKRNGQSPEVWARGVGWYAMALVEVLERMSPTDPQRAALEAVAQQLFNSIVRYQDPATGLWWQVMDKGAEKGNYLEASASCMFVYALAKAVRLGILGVGVEGNVTRGWEGIQKHFVKPDGTLTGTVKVAGLGGTPYRSGTYDYYVNDPVGDDDAKGVGAYLLALSEMVQRDRAADLLRRARAHTVLVDAWFNSQKRKLPDGKEELFHYKWSDDANSGYSAWAQMFREYGMVTEPLDHAPTAEDLKGVSIYVIVSPDIPALNPKAHFMDMESAEAIEAWVKAGGLLVVMENDSEHADQQHLNLLTDRFGIHFNAVTRNREVGDSYANTVVEIPAGTGGIFHQAHKAIMKETCTITVSTAAKAILSDAGTLERKGDVFMAVAHEGKGMVYANVDPWIYNEYTDGRKLPLGEDNFAAGLELTHWLVGEALR
jgi:unsaturated rhamnogalacturonyl hydrolase